MTFRKGETVTGGCGNGLLGQETGEPVEYSPGSHDNPRHYDQGQIAADGHRRNLGHLSQISWRGNVAHQVSRQLPWLRAITAWASHGPLRSSSTGGVSGRVRRARSYADRVFGTGAGCPVASD
jgi:hypothetical protein